MTGLQSFIFGGNTPWTYEELQRQKAIADSLRQANMATPRNVGEGLAAVGRALGARRREKRAGTREEELKAEMEAQIAAALGGGYGGGMAGISTPGITATGLGADPNSPQGIANETRDVLFPVQAAPTPAGWDSIKPGIFAGESGGDYNALFGYQNRPGGQFENIKITDMSVDEAIAFADPSGPYAQMVKGRVGRVATPLGAFQVVGSTLKDAKKALGLTGKERMSPELQEEIGKWVYNTQGTGAWEGYSTVGANAQPTGAQPTGGMTAEIAALLSNPMLPPAVRDLVMAQATRQAPMSEMDQLKLQRERLELERLQNPQVEVPKTLTERRALAAEAGLKPGTPEYTAYIATGNLVAPGGGAEFGLNPILGRDKDGNVVVMQLGKDGTAVVTAMPEGVTADIGLKPFETAQGAALGKGAGEAVVDAQTKLPSASGLADQVSSQIEALKNDPYLPKMLGPVDSRLPNVTEDAARVQGMMDQLKGGAFLQARQLLKGGGAITDFEGQKAEAAFIRMNAAQSVEDFKLALDEFNEAVQEGVAKLEAQARGGETSQAPSGGKVWTYNPATGEFE